MRSLFWGVGVRSLLGCGSAISFGVWECDRFLGCWECDRFLGMLGVRSLFGMLGVRSLLGLWGCDRFWDVGDVGMRSKN